MLYDSICGEVVFKSISAIVQKKLLLLNYNFTTTKLSSQWGLGRVYFCRRISAVFSVGGTSAATWLSLVPPGWVFGIQLDSRCRKKK